MSDAEAATATAEKSSRPSSGKGSYRRRRPVSKGPRADKPTTEETAKPSTPEGEETPKRERPEVTPVPEELVGTTQTGTVVITIRNRKYNFGFISLALGEKSEDTSIPRIYYNPSHIAEKGLNLYRGYEVTFEVSKDETGRTIAKNITLTENGAAIKATRDAEAEEKRKVRAAERAAAPVKAAPAATPATTEGEGEKKDGEGKKKKRAKKAVKKDAAPAASTEAAPAGEKKERPARRTATFEIVVEGDEAKTGTLNFAINQSIGRLKALATKAVEAPADLSVYLVTPENPAGVFLTRAVLNTVTESGKLLLAAKREADNLEK